MVARSLYVGKAGRRRDTALTNRHAPDLPYSNDEVKAEPITLPIEPDDIHKIASSGFPLWEPLDALQLRNFRITLAYGELSRRLAQCIAGTAERGSWDANWCTFATWSSKTIGTCIDPRPEHGQLQHQLRRLPPLIRQRLVNAAELFLSRGHGAMYRTLAVGNRFVFLEVGTAISLFLDSFEHESSKAKEAFDCYWAQVSKSLLNLSRLDPSWVATPAPDPTTLEAGLRAYYAAKHERDEQKRAQLVLEGNLLLGAYEQRRVDTYLTATLGFFTTTWLHRIIRGRGQGYIPLARRSLAAPLSALYSGVVTRHFLVLELPYPPPDNYLKVGRGVPPLEPGHSALLFPKDLQQITIPELQALLTHYDLSRRQNKRTRARNWSRYSHRMNYITNFFRSRQKDTRLFHKPWTDAEMQLLLAGKPLAQQST